MSLDEYRARRARLGLQDKPARAVPVPKYPSQKMRSEPIKRLTGYQRRDFERTNQPHACPHCGSRLLPSKQLIDIAREEADVEQVSVRDMRAAYKGDPRIVRARMRAMARSYIETEHTTTTIAKFYGDRDHSCVTYARKWYRAEGLA